MNGNVIIYIGIILIAVGTALTYFGSDIKSKIDTRELKLAISQKDSSIENLSTKLSELKNEHEKSLLIQEAPRIGINPERSIAGVKGNFKLSIENVGLSDVINIEIYEDYYVALKQKDSLLNLIRYGHFSTEPNTYFKSLLKGEKRYFTINFKDTFTEMVKLVLDRSVKGQRMMIARFKINITRKIDGNKYSYSKAFIIAGNADLLFDYDTSRELKYDKLEFTFDDIKKLLGVTL